MASDQYYQNVISQIRKRSVESTVSILGVSHKGLREHLIAELSQNNTNNGFLSDPVFESMFSWEKSDVTMDNLSGNLLAPSLVNAMDKAGEHRFERSWFPFKHQKKAWETLLNPPHKSLVVTSGTGSGKTECFMVPILNDLAKEYEGSGEPLTGVRALFLYPLNALINSQRERFRAWTDAYDDGLRFCLYNGNTEENKHKDQGKYPNEVLTRKVMRDKPAPMLVTNATMLEYMLVRQIDEPIIKQSHGKLRWIVLDEAHTYIGSQAAELSLLLRRVMHTFGVLPSDVRFVATSATIGDPKADEQLQEYLANLAGISTDQVVVVGGKREIPTLENGSWNDKELADLLEIDEGKANSNDRYQALCKNPIARKLRDELTRNSIPSSLSQLSKNVFDDEAKTEETLKWLDLCSSTVGSATVGGEQYPFLPVRGHLFHQVLSGLWCCSDKSCTEKQNTPLKTGWPFGNVYTQRKTHCECGSPVYELSFCNDCNTPHLLAVEHDGSLVQIEREALDEFSLDYEAPEELDDETLVGYRNQVIIASEPHSELTYSVSINNDRKLAPPGMDTIDLNLLQPKDQACCHCEYSGYKGPFYRRSLLGTPFYISNTVPTLLGACQESDDASNRPNRGRRLITFTDSRQGTARISTKIQQDSERDAIRGLTYAEVANNVSAIDPAKAQEKQEKLKGYETKIEKLLKIGEPELAEDIEELAQALRSELEDIGSAKPLSWNEAVSKFHASPDISRWIFDYYKEINPQLFAGGNGQRILVEMLLLREFARRPKRQNSMETLGLVSIQYPALEQISVLPPACASLGLTIEDWRSFLKMALDFYLRENSIIDIPDDWVNWMGAKIYAKAVVKPNSDEQTHSRLMRWPQVVKGRNNRLVRLLIAAFDIDINNSLKKDLVNDVLKEAWSAVTKKHLIKDPISGQNQEHQILKPVAGSIHFKLDRSEISFKASQELWVCPVTHRLLDSTFKGLTPYLPLKYEKEKVLCRKVSTEVCQFDASSFNSDKERVETIRSWIDEQEAIASLRSENLWTDVSDRIVEGGKFFRAAEHSAQQPASLLDTYEALFKSGRLNVLSCSTTMEMGVDIGGISVVAMNNVPPHPANYLQRAGRAGRRGETQALAFTICKDNPHERSVFSNPVWPFITAIPAPHITLNSERIIQRHINALLMAYFLKEVISVTQTAVTSLHCNWFFSAEGGSEAPVDRMQRWLGSFLAGSVPKELEFGLKSIVKGSILASYSLPHIIQKAIGSLSNTKDQWLPAYIRLKVQAESVAKLSEKDPLRRKVEYDLKCMGEQYLLSELASKAFLPGYGFPTGIVTFDHYSMSDFKRGKYLKSNGRIDNLTRMKERPGRQMAVAIREYAPGAEVILNGLVYKSQGILLNKFSPNEDYSEPQKLVKEWRCHNCGCIGNEAGATFNELCSECGSELKEENIKEYIAPIGFAVDFYSSPSTDISSQTYIPVEEPWVTANAPMQSLFDPRLGTFRVSSEGHIFHHSSGENGTGYAVCLRCGRAESMDLNGDYPPNLQPGKKHNKLQGKQSSDGLSSCEGSDEAYAIKENVHLGATDQTDVFELFLMNPAEGAYLRHRSGDELPWTLAVVLRQALADIHGINAEEMGYTVKASTVPDCTYPVAGIALYDNNGGGAGFSSSAHTHFREMLIRAMKYLECKDHCESACQACLLGYDTRFHSDVLNRHIAKDYLESLEGYLDLPSEAQIFGASTKHCFDSLSEELLASINKGGVGLKIFLSGNYQDWDISSSNLKEACLTWKQSFETVTLVLPGLDLNLISSVHKDDLRALNNFGVHIAANKSVEISKLASESLLAQVEGDGKIFTFGSNAPSANTPDQNWLSLDGYHLVTSDVIESISLKEIGAEWLADTSVIGDVELDLESDCDGLVSQFGIKLWQQIENTSEPLSSIFKSGAELTSISYSDAYICSPWTLMLFGEVINALKCEHANCWGDPIIVLRTGDKPANPSSKGLYGEWNSSDDKSEVITEYFDQMGEEIKVEIKSKHDISHGRILTLRWKDGTHFTIRFDHGFGCWSIDGKTSKWFEVDNEPSKQVSDMFDMLNSLKVRFSKKFPTQVFIKRNH